MSLLLSPPHSTHKTSSKFLPATKSGTSSALRCILAALQILRGHLSVRTLSLSQAVLVPSPPGRHHHLPHTMRPAPGAGKPHGLFSRSVKAQRLPPRCPSTTALLTLQRSDSHSRASPALQRPGDYGNPDTPPPPSHYQQEQLIARPTGGKNEIPQHHKAVS